MIDRDSLRGLPGRSRILPAGQLAVAATPTVTGSDGSSSATQPVLLPVGPVRRLRGSALRAGTGSGSAARLPDPDLAGGAS